MEWDRMVGPRLATSESSVQMLQRRRTFRRPSAELRCSHSDELIRAALLLWRQSIHTRSASEGSACALSCRKISRFARRIVVLLWMQLSKLWKWLLDGVVEDNHSL